MTEPEPEPGPEATDPAELARLADLLNEVFDPHPPASVDALRWYYDENPVGRASVGRVEEGDRRLGNYALIPQVFERLGHPDRRLGVGVDLSVSPDARGSGAFRRTVEDSYVRGAADGLDGILGVANANSAPRMVKTLGWRALDPLPVTLSTLAARAPGFSAHVVTPEVLESDLLDEVSAGGFALPVGPGWSPVWTPEYLRWRLARPGARYVLHVSDDLVVVSTAERIKGVPFAMVLKVLARHPLLRPARLSVVARAVAGHHRTPFVVHWGRNPHLVVKGVRLPQERMPSPLALVLHSFHDDFVPAGFELAAMEFLDFDAY